ncbi:MAG: alginate lyase family protein [Balneolales bacterium]
MAKKYSFINIFLLLLLAVNYVITAATINDEVLILASTQPDTSNEWQDIVTVEDLWNNHHYMFGYIFSALDLQREGLGYVNENLQNQDTLEAAKALLEYYKTNDTPEWLRSQVYYSGSREEKKRYEQVLNNEISWSDSLVKIPVNEDGGWNWNYTGEEPDAELGYTLNRHRFFVDLLRGWQETGNSVYAKKFDRLLRDWIIHNPLPGEDDLIWEVHRTTTDELDWRDIGEVVWRGLEVGLRIGESWPQVFYGFQQSDEFTPAARLMMLYSLPVHASYIQEHHDVNHNHATMEMDGLSTTGLAFSEYKQSEEWINHALKVMQNEISEGQVYPDGVQKEMASSYHWVALQRFENLADNFQLAGRSMPIEYHERLEAMYNYLAYSMGPDGYIPLNNDSGRLDIRQDILTAAERYNRPDWIYIATNGEKGEKPQGLASYVFPWAGIHIMRSGWDKDAHWSFYKTGPYGIGHQHRDKLHLSIRAYGRDLLVDSGPYTYEDYFSFNPTSWRGYFRSSFSQNVILIDGAGQNPWARIADEPQIEGLDYVITSEFDFAKGTFSEGYEKISGESIEGQAEHTRTVVYIKNKYWVVVDQINTDRPRELQALWRYAPDLDVMIEGNRVTSQNSSIGNLGIIPVSDLTWEPSLIKGQTNPYIMGWYSETRGKKEPITTVVYSASIDDDAVFAWILVPVLETLPDIQATLVKDQTIDVLIEEEGEEPVSVSLPLKDGVPEVKI